MSAESHHSQDWYRVADSRPRLRGDVVVARHLYLGRPWHVLAGRTGTKVHRLTPAAWAIAGRLDGSLLVEDLWQELTETLGEEAPTQDEVVQLLIQLHGSDLLDNAETPLLAEALERRDRDRGMIWKKLFLNPLSVTLPLIDPDRGLAWLARRLAPLPPVLWWSAGLVLLLWAGWQLPLHWPALTARGLEGFLDLQNLALLALIYPVVKGVHELAHGLATRARGGEVHQMGLMFVAFYPIPYVEASAALVFPSKWDRAAVAAAGVMAELCIAALAFLLWINVEPGALRTVLFNTMVISGLSTLLVNGNPLLKFDGYHVLCDVAELPNLAGRGNSWWGEMLRTRVLGTRERPRARMMATGWERPWFLFYPPAAFVYRVGISLSIALFVAQTYRLLGILLAIWSLALSLVWPALKTAHKALTDGRIRAAGGRAAVRAAVAALVLAGLVFVLPLPHRAVVDGVTWLPEEAVLRSPEAARIGAVHLGDGQPVTPGTVLFTLDQPELPARQAMAAARLARVRADLAAARVTDRSRAAELTATLAQAEAELHDADRRLAGLSVVAALPGRFALAAPDDQPGRHVERGAVLGHVLVAADPVVRLALPQDLAALLQDELAEIEIRFADDIATIHPARLLRSVPAGADQLPSAVLSLDGGGPWATLPDDGSGALRAVVRLYQVDLALVDGARPAWGMRAHVRLTFAPKPLALRVARALREVFLNVLAV